ncbi:MAG TPA: hypothetical protein VJZ27_01895 [Aggregatilineales bacterium]|nr:hypothetical protein [Aggregatilineales bacterium]
MQLIIDKQPREFTDIKNFRHEYRLTEDFGVDCFESKDYTGLGRIDDAGAVLNDLRRHVLESLPRHLLLMAWLDYTPTLQAQFRDELEAINAEIGLREEEMDFAAAGFGDVCRAVIYGLIYARAQQQPPAHFEKIYADWLFSTVRISGYEHRYEYNGGNWMVQVVSHAYGRIGLVIRTPDEVYHVLDKRLACPAEGYMLNLLEQVAAHIMSNAL